MAKSQFWIARYRCRGCGIVFEAEAGPNNGQCPACGHIWLDWLNYEDLRKGNK